MQITKFLWCLIIVCLAACTKQDPQPVNINFERIQLFKANRLYEEFERNKEATWLENRRYESALSDASGRPPLLARSRYAFNDQNQLIASEHEGYATICGFCPSPTPPSSSATSHYTLTYEYKNGLLTQANRQEIRNSQPATVGKTLFHFNAKGQLERVEQWYGFSGPLTLFETLAFQYDARGNLRQQERFAANGFKQEVLTYQYDDKPNPFYSLKLPEFAPRYLSPNNVVHTHRRIFDPADLPDTIRQEEETKKYTYSAEGWPTSIEADNQTLTVMYR
ncbi:hypothetical protein ACFPMF_17310 [Larkinella bovis]|uniref:YD repeat-containing protein n=1 Tax=Larkinella bovis TaxID=683041 RepID=A0ABW0IEC7_9BACT